MKDESLTIRLSSQEKEKLKEMARERDIPVSQLVREICREIFKGVNSNE